jgi:hypothetical protein
MVSAEHKRTNRSQYDLMEIRNRLTVAFSANKFYRLCHGRFPHQAIALQ